MINLQSSGAVSVQFRSIPIDSHKEGRDGELLIAYVLDLIVDAA